MALTTITKEMVSVNAIQGTLIADNAITAVHIATNAVSGTLIADNAVTATHIAQNTITVTQLADDCVESAKIADGIITTNHLNKAMISSQTEVAVATGDFVLIGDTSDSNNLKKAPISSILAGTLTTAAQTNITSLGTLTGLTMGGDITKGSGEFKIKNTAEGQNVGIYTTSSSSEVHALKIHSGGNVEVLNGSLLVGNNSDTQSILGRTALGFVTGLSDYAYVGHLDVADSGGYALVQSSAGATFLNAEDGQNLSLSIHGTRKMILDSNGNIGFGTTDLPTGMGSNSYKQFKIGGGILADSGHSSGHNIMLGNNVYVGASNDLKFTHAAAASVINMTSGDINFRTHDGGGASADGTATLNSRFYIKENGNIGVATTSPDSPFHISAGNPNSTADAIFFVSKTGANDFTAKFGSGADDYGLHIRGSGNYAWSVFDHSNDVYRARITFGGQLLLTDTTIASISDRRLKKNIVDASSQWNDIKALKWRNFEWKEESKTETYLGLIADEVEAVSPNLVQIDAQPKEDIDAGIPDPKHKTVKYSIVWMKAMKALQEAQERIETLEAEVKALKEG